VHALPTPRNEASGLSPNARWGIGAIVAVVIGSIAFFGVRLGNEVANLATIDRLEVSDCVEDHFQTSGSVETGEFFSVLFVTRVSCSEPHAYEMYAKSTTLWGPDALYPGVDAVFADGQAFCQEQYDEFVGGDYFSSPYDFFTFVPPTEVWAEGGRDVRCLVGYTDGVTLAIGSLEGRGPDIAS